MKTNYELVRDIFKELNKGNEGKKKYQIVEDTPSDTFYILLGESYIAEINAEFMEVLDNPFEFFIDCFIGWKEEDLDKTLNAVKDLYKAKEIFDELR